MDKTKRKRLEAAGWRTESAENLLDLTSEEATLVDRGVTATGGQNMGGSVTH